MIVFINISKIKIRYGFQMYRICTHKRRKTVQCRWRQFFNGRLLLMQLAASRERTGWICHFSITAGDRKRFESFAFSQTLMSTDSCRLIVSP